MFSTRPITRQVIHPLHRSLHHLLLAVALGLCSTGSLAADTTLERIKNTGQVNIGYRPAAVPFSYVLPEQTLPVGYAISICHRVVEDLRKELKLPPLKINYIPVDPKSRFSQLDEDKIDMECANTTVTADRRQKGYAFSIPYFITGSKVLVRSTIEATHIRELFGKTVLVAENTTTAATMQDRNNTNAIGLKFKYFKKRAEAFALLEDNQADAMVEDTTVLLGFKANSKNPSGYKVIGDYLAVEPFAIMFKGSSTGLKVSADRTMRELMRSGDLVRLHSTWFETPIPPKNLSLDIPLGHLMRDMIRYPNDQVNAFP